MLKEKDAGSKSAQKVKEELPHYERASPTLLSEEPSSPPEKRLTPSKVRSWHMLLSHLQSRLVGLRTWRESWWSQNWANLAQYIEPRRSIWLTQSTGGLPTPNNMTRGRQINQSIVDPTATFAVRICSGGLMSGLASPSRPWFKIVPSMKNVQLDAAGREWIDDVEERMYTILAGSNFYNSFAQECEDLVVFGTAPVIIYEDEQDVLRCYNPVTGEYYLGSGATMRVDGLYRTFVMTVSQIVDFFGVEKCTPDVQKLWEAKGNSLEVERIIAHSIEPNYGIGPNEDGKLPGGFTWREVYWVYTGGSDQPLAMRGFMECPFTAGRWSTQGNDPYGRSPGMDVLPDVIQLQVETLRKAEAIEKMVRPPLVADMQLKNQPSSILPGHVTYVSNLGPGTGMRSIYDVNPDIKAMAEDLAMIQARIKTGFFNDLFLMLETAPSARMTAYEVSQKMMEKLQVLGPVIEGLLTESLKPKLKRVFSIMKRKGMIPPPPPSMRGMPVDIEFVSILALAQKAAATGGLERIASLIGNMAAVFPQARDMLNVDTFVREMSDLLGNPQKILNAPEQVAQIRAAQQKQMEAAAQQQGDATAANTAESGANAAQVLSQTKIGGGTDALSAILGTGGKSNLS